MKIAVDENGILLNPMHCTMIDEVYRGFYSMSCSPHAGLSREFYYRRPSDIITVQPIYSSQTKVVHR